MSDSALLAVLLAAIAGVVAGRLWASALRRAEARERAGFRLSSHYLQGLHYLAGGQADLAVSELTKVSREEPDAVEVQVVLGNLLRERGQVERAIQMHQGVLGRHDLSRAERGYVLACLGADFQKAGFVDRAGRAFDEALEVNPKDIHALVGRQKLQEGQRQWAQAYESQTRLSRQRRTDDSLVLGHLQAEMGREAAQAGRREAAEQAFRTALSLDRRVFPAHLGLAALHAESDPRRAAGILEAAIQAAPDRAYLAFEPLAQAFAACGEASRFVQLCEHLIARDPRDWRARLALARHLRGQGQHEEALGLLLRAVEANPQALAVHHEVWKTLQALPEAGPDGGGLGRYVARAEDSVFYWDPHVCTMCRYRADDMLWRCPHCHEWGTFVEERLGPTP